MLICADCDEELDDDEVCEDPDSGALCCYDCWRERVLEASGAF